MLNSRFEQRLPLTRLLFVLSHRFLGVVHFLFQLMFVGQQCVPFTASVLVNALDGRIPSFPLEFHLVGMTQLLHQLLALFECRTFLLRVFHQSADVEHVVQIRLNLNLQVFRLRVSKFVLQILVQTQLSELVLQVNSKVHVLHRMHDYVHELHARHHEVNVEYLEVREVVHQSLEAIAFDQNFLEMVERVQNYLMSTFDETDGRQQFEHK